MSKELLRFALALAIAAAVLVAVLVVLDTTHIVNLSRLIRQPKIQYVYYSDFGAKGDGKTDDFNAIIAAHAYANTNNSPTNKCVVKAAPGVTYYIGAANKAKVAIVKTDTDWGDAKFIIDDSKLTSNDTDPGEKYYINAHHIFSIESSLNPISLSGDEAAKYTLTKGMAKLDLQGLALQGDTLVVAENYSKRQFGRVGYDGSGSSNGGENQTDLFKIDKYGSIDQNSPVIWDFTPTSITFYPIDPDILTVSGGQFTTICDRVFNSGYLKRGIDVKRSNTIVKNVDHKITNERTTLLEGTPYAGFFFVNTAYNVTIKDCTVNANRRVYQGSYDLYVYRSAKVLFDHVLQTNDIMNYKRFGVICMEYAKDVTFDGCELNRFDAHQGVTNTKVLNCKIGFDGMNLVGSGTFYMKNTTVTSDYMLSLRPDYGTRWDGDIIADNCTYIMICSWDEKTDTPSRDDDGCGRLVGTFIGARYYGGVDFGYQSMLPKNVTFSNLIVKRLIRKSFDPATETSVFEKADLAGLYVFYDYLHPTEYNPGKQNEYALGAPKTATINGITGISVDKVIISSGEEPSYTGLFKDVDFKKGE